MFSVILNPIIFAIYNQKYFEINNNQVQAQQKKFYNKFCSAG